MRDRRRSLSRVVMAAVVTASGAATIGSTGASAQSSGTSTAPLVSTRANELSAAESIDVLAWSRDDRRSGLRVNALARFDGQRIRLNQSRSDGLVGGVDGHRVSFVQMRGWRSRIRVTDVSTGEDVPLHSAVNQPGLEMTPTISGDWILYGRWSGIQPYPSRVPERSAVYLSNYVTGEVRVLQTTRRNRLLLPGQLNGVWASWSMCGTRSGCHVYRYNVETDTRTQVAVADSALYAASTHPSGDVFFARSGYACGRRVRLIRAGIDGSREIVAHVPKGYDLFRTFAHATSESQTRILYDRLRCKNSRSDIYVTTHTVE